MASCENVIEKRIELKAPVSRVWRAITDYREFGEWFKVRMEAPFVPGVEAHGQIAHPGYEHVTMSIVIEKIDPETLFSYTWRPYAVKPDIDYTQETPTLVEFRLTEIPGGTLLVVTESGFEHVPAGRRDEAFRMNDRGWASQVKNIEAYLARGN